MKRKIMTISLCVALIITSMFPFISNTIYAAENEWNFEYIEGVEEWVAPYSGKYFFEVYGASGGGATEQLGGLGGSATGYVNLKKGTKLYIACGEQGSVSTTSKSAAGGWNGGGNAVSGAGSGGGATSITLADRGELRNFADHQDEVVMVAGAGAGKGSHQYVVETGPSIGCGGSSACNAPYVSLAKLDELNISHEGNFGFVYGSNDRFYRTSNGEYSFGLAQDSYSLNYGYGGAGGGGYYGGMSSFVGLTGGAGGSSYAYKNVYDFYTELNKNQGNGKAKITYLDAVETHVVINTNNCCSINNESGFITINLQSSETVDLGEPDMYENYHFLGYELESGDGEIDGTLFTAGVEASVIKVKYSVDLVLKGELTGDVNLNTQRLTLKFEQPDDEEKVYRVYQSTDEDKWYFASFAEDVVNGKLPDYVFNFIGGEQTLTLKGNAYLQLFTYGAQGGNDSGGSGGYGGYAYGEKELPRYQKLYISVGGTSVAFNGGNYTTAQTGAGGGGATHIATASGQLSSFGNSTNAAKYVLLVAGGGGANSDGGIGGTGGGTNGANGGGSYCGLGATQTSGYAFGQGQPAYGQAAGGGGGWYGGYAVQSARYVYGMGAGGGSGWIGGVNNGSMRNGAKAVHGQAIIRVIDSVETDSFLDEIYVPDKAAPNTPSNGKYDSVGNTITVTWQNNGDNGSTYYHQVKSYSAEDTSILLKESNILENYIETGVQGFYYYVDSNPTGTVTKSHTFTENAEIEITTSASNRYLHVAAVDGAGNISGTYDMLIPCIAKYTVNHYAQNEDGTYTLVETEEFMDTIGKTVTPEVHPQTGRDNPPAQSVVITADGQTTVNYYYDVTRFDINGTVQWNDHNNIYGTRPEDIKVTLYRDGEYFDEVIVSAADNSNGYSFPDVQKYDLEIGREFVYTVEQETAYSQAALATSEDKYLTRQNGFNFLNTINNTNADKPEKPDPDNSDDKGFFVEGNIYWEDNNDSLGFRPSEVTITLYQKGEDGEFVEFDSVIVDANTENHYLFDWLPKYWYDEDGVPTKYEYKVEETFTSWYVEDGVIKDAYEIYPDTPKDCNFTNKFIFPDKPIIPVNEYTNTLTIVTNTEEEVRIVLKPEELIVSPDYSVSYGDLTGDNVSTLVDNTGAVLTDLPSTRYEIVIDFPEYTIEDMNLVLSENMKLEKVGDKWYLVIENQPADAIGTLEIEFLKKEVYYQDKSRINNYFACPNRPFGEAAKISMMSLASIFVDGKDTAIDSEEKAEISDNTEITDISSEASYEDVYKEADNSEIKDDSTGMSKNDSAEEIVAEEQKPDLQEQEFMEDDSEETVIETLNDLLAPEYDSE